MMKRRKAARWNPERELPILGELTDCRQISNDCWRGTDVDSTVLEVRGGAMPRYLIGDARRMMPCRHGFTHYGIIRVIPAEDQPAS